MKTWSNVVCKFETKNDTNNLGNSKYFITETGMQRAAFVNSGPNRPADQVVWKNRGEGRLVCYFAEGSELDTLLDADVNGLAVEKVEADAITLKLTYVSGSSKMALGAHRTPHDGDFVLDGVVAQDGIYSNWHPGHKLQNLLIGPLNDDERAAAIAAGHLYRFEATVNGPLPGPVKRPLGQRRNAMSALPE